MRQRKEIAPSVGSPLCGLAPYPLELLQPDDFLLGLLEEAPGLIWRTLQDQAARYQVEDVDSGEVRQAQQHDRS
jgi:hypothetical protein